MGYPGSGKSLQVTQGVVSRIEVQRYEHSRRHLIAVTVDAAINDGNSGGPAYLDDNVVGMAFQSLQAAENIGEIVPTPLIEQFLSAVEKQKKLIGIINELQFHYYIKNVPNRENCIKSRSDLSI